MDYYPNLSSAQTTAVRVALDQLELDPLWLDRPACPYDEATVEGMRALWSRVRAAVSAKPERGEVQLEGDAWETLGVEANNILRDLIDMRDDIQGAEASDKLAYFKAAAALMERMVQLGERANNIKHVSDFTRRVMDVFEQVLSPEQRTRATEMLGQ